MLWLQWFAAFLDAAAGLAPFSKHAQSMGHAWLDRIERMVVVTAMLRAVPHVRRVIPRRGVAEHRRKESALTRAVLGSALRRSFRAKDLRQRIERLTQSIDMLVARLLRRLPRGLTRRRPILARREREADLVHGRDICAPIAPLSDTS